MLETIRASPTATHTGNLKNINSATRPHWHTEAPDYFLFQGLKWIRSRLTMTVIFCWIKVWFILTPALPLPGHRSISSVKLLKTSACFHDDRWAGVLTVCNSTSCIQSTSFVSRCSLQKDVNGTCNCMFGSYNKTVLAVRFVCKRTMLLSTLKPRRKCVLC